MRKVITFGVFDYFHYGHLRLLQKAKSYGDYLIVALQDSDSIKTYKPDARIMYTNEQRKEMLSALRMVDEVVFYTDVDKDIQKVEFDVFARGEDQNHSGFEKATQYALENGKCVETLTRTQGICSSDIKRTILDKRS